MHAPEDIVFELSILNWIVFFHFGLADLVIIHEDLQVEVEGFVLLENVSNVRFGGSDLGFDCFYCENVLLKLVGFFDGDLSLGWWCLQLYFSSCVVRLWSQRTRSW